MVYAAPQEEVEYIAMNQTQDERREIRAGQRDLHQAMSEKSKVGR